MLDERKAAILAALVEAYIASGSPVSSRAVLERSELGCSTATIRNEFVLLEQDAYIAKPRASAGRIPTDRGYRYYVDHREFSRKQPNCSAISPTFRLWCSDRD